VTNCYPIPLFLPNPTIHIDIDHHLLSLSLITYSYIVDCWCCLLPS